MNEQITLDTAPEVSFAELGVPARLVNALTKLGKSNAFPIQIATLPSTLEGRDVLGRGKTGSGKTLAFSIPLVSRLSDELAGGARLPGPTRRPHEAGHREARRRGDRRPRRG